MSEIDPKMLKTLLEAFEGSNWEELSLSLPGGDSLHLSRDPDGDLPSSSVSPPSSPPAASGDSASVSSGPAPGPPAAATTAASGAAPPAPAGAAGEGAAGVPVESTTVGIFWVAPTPGAPPFVSVGDQVGADDTVGIVEVMKLMNHIPAGVEGVVTAVLVGNGEPVEFGQPLVLIDPSG